MDRARVRMSWANMRMQTNENSFEFRKRVENHQLQRASVGLPIIPESELVIGILNKLDMSRYAQLSSKKGHRLSNCPTGNSPKMIHLASATELHSYRQFPSSTHVMMTVCLTRFQLLRLLNLSASSQLDKFGVTQ